MMTEWISVADRLPEESGEYITMTNAKGRSKGVIAQKYEITKIRGKEVRRWRWLDRISPWTVTHWMPLPEPPNTSRMICLNCNHMECMDYIHGTGICAILEGETVILSDECICPKDIYDETEAFLRSNGKGDKCNG